ncbi:hypothetical protein A2335_04210 [Candidatus Peregrinibacteria bacterium RIFOXYB2_FULL_32_7]|nr:MAG: hypothetical protein A2335_04210 [Candidatus Peregrinibacteria bacterium RIFOXYB2_FULL_32_7]
MKIVIDISLAVGNRAGIGNYSYNLAKQLAKIDKKNKYTFFPFFCYIYHPDFKNIPLDFSNPNCKLKYKYLPKEWIDYLWKESIIPKNDIIGDCDILHSTSFCVPENIKSKLAVTIYDVSFVTHPQFHQEANIQHCYNGTKKAVEKADVIIAISEHTKNDLIKYFNCPPEKIKVTYLGYDQKIFRVIKEKNKIQNILKKYNIKKSFIFNLGTIEPRKNIKGLIKAYSLLDNKTQNQHDLVIAGGKGWLNSEIYSLIKETNLEEKIKFLGYVDENDLPYLYNVAKCFVYPSFYEGFGLPPLEALACACPVISSNISSLPEVVGNAGLLIDPNDNQQISEAIKNVLINTSLRENLKKKALLQAKKFSWELCAQETLSIYNQLLT